MKTTPIGPYSLLFAMIASERKAAENAPRPRKNSGRDDRRHDQLPIAHAAGKQQVHAYPEEHRKQGEAREAGQEGVHLVAARAARSSIAAETASAPNPQRTCCQISCQYPSRSRPQIVCQIFWITATVAVTARTRKATAPTVAAVDARRRLEEILHGARRLVVQAHVRADAVGEVPSGDRGEEDQVGEEPQQHDRRQQQRLVHEVDAIDRRSHTSPAVLSCQAVSALRQAESARRRVFSNLTFRSASLTDSHSPAYELQT